MIGATLILAAAAAIATVDPAADAGPIMPVRPHSHIHAGQQTPGEGPIVLDVTYSSDMMGVVAGGVKRRARYLDNLDLVLEVDLEDLVGWEGAEMHVYGLYNNGQSMSEVVGDAQMVSEIEANAQAFKLYEAWIDQMVAPNLSLRAGIYDLNSEFDVLETATLFVGGAHGMGSDIGMSGRNGPSIFPATGLAARVLYRPAEGWAVRAAILDGMPGNPEHPSRTSVRLGGGEGALLIGEVEAADCCWGIGAIPLPSTGSKGRMAAAMPDFTCAAKRPWSKRAKGGSTLFSVWAALPNITTCLIASLAQALI